MKNLKQFVGMYPIQKTLRFDLKPCLLEGQSLDDFWKDYLDENKVESLYNHDKNRNEQYPVMKIMLDEFHKRFIVSSLESFLPDEKCPSWEDLFVANCKDRKSIEFKDMQNEMRKYLHRHFTKHEWWPYFSSYSKLIGDKLKSLIKNDNDFVESVQEHSSSLTRDDMLFAVNTFSNFSVYFGKYAENRNNMYSEKEQGTSIANRIVNENYPKFMDNISVYKRLKELCPNELKEIEHNLSDALKGKKLDEIFYPDYYGKCFTQEGIENYNWIIGGNPNEKVLGVNSVGNEYLQHHPESKLKLRDLKMKQLFKQILSDRVQPSFLPEQYQSEEELIESISTFLKGIEEQGIFECIRHTMETLKEVNTDLSKIYVQGANLTSLSRLLYGNWNLLGETLRKRTVTANTKAAQKERDKEIEKWLANKCFSISQIQAVEEELIQQTEHPMSIIELLSTLNVWKKDYDTHEWKMINLIEQCRDAYIVEFLELKRKFTSGYLKSNVEARAVIKSILDKYMELFHFVELLRLGNKSAYLEQDSFYVDYEQLFVFDNEEELCISQIVPLYNKVRSFLTRKVSSEGKMLLKFDSPTRANGWSDCSIVRKQEKYYLVIYVSHLDEEEKKKLYSGTNAELVSYEQQKIDFMNAPRLFINSKGDNRSPAVHEYSLPIDMIEPLYKKRKGLTTKAEIETFNKENPDYETKLIDYYKIGYLRHKDFKTFRTKFHKMWRDSSDYSSIQEFFAHTQEMCYQLSFERICFESLCQLQSNNKIILFEIFNKDFKEEAKGTPNMHTLYWKELFTERNLNDVVFKLSSQSVELFYKRKTKGKPYVHKKGTMLVNKTLADGTPISGEMYRHFVQYFNAENIKLTTEERTILPLVKTNKAKIDIIKDKRYYEHKFYLHVPITINFKKSSITQQKFNEKTLEILRNSKEELNIIGIDRGERNLIYVSVINQRGENIIPPRHYNLIESKSYDGIVRKFNYLEKLTQIENTRKKAQKEWMLMARISDLKSGYLSQVVHEIAKLVVEYNAIIVLEELNYGFKRGRFNVERQVYQKFETMLIQKLNYLAFKTNSPSIEYGNIWNGLQLTAPFTSFKELGRQSGWLFYVPAGYTSKIDPITGFVNLFSLNRPANDFKTFFSSFEEIAYRNNMFYFRFDYSNDNIHTVQSDYQNKWTLSTHGDRICGREEKNESLTQKFASFFLREDVNIPLKDISVSRVASLEESKLKEFFGLFKLLLKMRNSNSQEDYIISPVASDIPFKTGDKNQMKIYDADANGAYNIALKVCIG